MSKEISYLENLDIVLVKTSGIYKFVDEMETIEKAIQKMRECDCSRLLFDHREAEVIVSPAMAVHRTKQYDDVGFSRTMRIACIARENNEELEFFELASSNRGWQTKLFTQYEAAINWLTKA